MDHKVFCDQFNHTQCLSATLFFKQIDLPEISKYLKCYNNVWYLKFTTENIKFSRRWNLWNVYVGKLENSMSGSISIQSGSNNIISKSHNWVREARARQNGQISWILRPSQYKIWSSLLLHHTSLFSSLQQVSLTPFL